MAEEKKKTITARKKPKFLRTDWHKKIRLGRGVKKNLKWHAAKGRQNKLRLNRKGRMQRPKVGWGATIETKGFVNGMEAVRVENVAEIEAVARNSVPSKKGSKDPASSGKKGQGIIIAKVGAKKRIDMIAKAKEMRITILNRYMEKKA